MTEKDGVTSMSMLDEIDRSDLSSSFDRLGGFRQYRHYKLFSRNQQTESRLQYLLEKIGEEGAIAGSLYNGTELLGCCIACPLPWDSEHFGMKMARLECVFPQSISVGVARALIDNVMRRAACAGIVHVSIFVDAEDYALANAIVKNGFDLLDTRLMFLARDKNFCRDEGKTMIRDYELGDRAAVSGIVAALNFPSRFSRDTVLRRENTSDMYLKWVDRLYEARQDGVLIVAHRHGQVVACAGLGPVTMGVGSHDAVFLGSSFMACSRGGIGCSHGMVARGINEGLRRYPLVEFSTSINNLSMIRILESHGCKLGGASHAFRWFRAD